MSVKINLNDARPVWEEIPSVIAVWCFGSAMGGIVKSGSDLDIAILFSSPPSFELLADIRTKLQELFNMEDIDLLILNSANTISGMEAISGKPVFCKDINERAKFVSLLARQYEDDMAFLEKALHLSNTSK